MTTSAAPLIPAERPEPAIKANAAPGTLFTMGRSARSGRGPVPANRRATPMVVGARARRPFPIRWWQNLAAAKVALKDVGKSRTRLFEECHVRRDTEGQAHADRAATRCGSRKAKLAIHPHPHPIWATVPASGLGSLARPASLTSSHPSGAPRPDGIGRGLSGFLLPLLARARHLLMQEIFSQPARARQSSPRCMSDVFKTFRRFGVLTAFHGDETTMERHEACSKNPTMRFTA